MSIAIAPGFVLDWPVLTMDTSRAAADSESMDEAADRSDIQATLGRDGEAYRRLIERHQARIARRMRRFTRDRGTLEELVHDVFIEAYFSLKNFRGDAPFERWLAKIATRVGYRYWKRTAREKLTSAMPESVPAAREAESDDQLHAVLAELPPRDRLVVTLLYLEEQSVAEVARLTGWSRTMVKVQAFRARGKLRKSMEAHHE